MTGKVIGLGIEVHRETVCVMMKMYHRGTDGTEKKSNWNKNSYVQEVLLLCVLGVSVVKNNQQKKRRMEHCALTGKVIGLGIEVHCETVCVMMKMHHRGTESTEKKLDMKEHRRKHRAHRDKIEMSENATAASKKIFFLCSLW